MDAYVDLFQGRGGSMVMLAKGNRSPAVREACRKHGGFYLGSIGGPAARLAEHSIKKVEVLEYAELGMEAIWRIEVEDFPAFTIIDAGGQRLLRWPHREGARGRLACGGRLVTLLAHFSERGMEDFAAFGRTGACPCGVPPHSRSSAGALVTRSSRLSASIWLACGTGRPREDLERVPSHPGSPVRPAAGSFGRQHRRSHGSEGGGREIQAI
jgi:hypothetical protein